MNSKDKFKLNWPELGHDEADFCAWGQKSQIAVLQGSIAENGSDVTARLIVCITQDEIYTDREKL